MTAPWPDSDEDLYLSLDEAERLDEIARERGYELLDLPDEVPVAEVAVELLLSDWRGYHYRASYGGTAVELTLGSDVLEPDEPGPMDVDWYDY